MVIVKSVKIVKWEIKRAHKPGKKENIEKLGMLHSKHLHRSSQLQTVSMHQYLLGMAMDKKSEYLVLFPKSCIITNSNTLHTYSLFK